MMELNYFDTEIGRCVIEVRDYTKVHGFDGFEITDIEYVVFDEDGQMVVTETLHEMNKEEMDEFVLTKVMESEMEEPDAIDAFKEWRDGNEFT